MNCNVASNVMTCRFEAGLQKVAQTNRWMVGQQVVSGWVDHRHRGHHQLMASCDGERSGDVREGQTRLMERQGGTKVHMAKTANLHYVYNLML